MKYKVSLADILELLTVSMVFPVTINNVAISGDLQTLSVCDVYHAQEGFIFEIGGIDYTIQSVDPALKQIVLDKGITNPLTAGTSSNLYEPFFFHGTPYAINSEVIGQKKISDKRTPMVWLLEEFSEVFHDDTENTHERDSDVHIFFLTHGDFKKVINEMASDYIEPMSRLMENFIKAHNKERRIFEHWDLDYKVTRYSKFGIYITNKGEGANLFADTLSGVENEITLKLLKNNVCGCIADDVYVSDEEDIIYLADDNESLLIF